MSRAACVCGELNNLPPPPRRGIFWGTFGVDQMSESDNKVLGSVEKKKLPPAAGMGRKPGVQNKLTKTIKEAIEASFDMVGGAEYLARMAVQEPVAYMGLLGKVLPTQVKIKTDEPLQVTFNVIEPTRGED